MTKFGRKWNKFWTCKKTPHTEQVSYGVSIVSIWVFGRLELYSFPVFRKDTIWSASKNIMILSSDGNFSSD